ncbi:hypothetical protein [Aerolutibacter ruishenii]|uniref:Protein FliT n=1 Tax=Aerolutibacter ruishenii TaxID=686800 RepID=A0A562LN18_9GAMM|nr:hypothetical protein [Lysobacter ruishenii]TWI09024.1 hypothetical protein IP93_02181 [Lysobacter ruishenii]
MIPKLPVEAVRRAMSEGDWEASSNLLATHDAAVQRTLESATLTAEDLSQWQSLLVEQLELLAELQVARDQTGQRLREMAQQRRGMNAYLRGALG